MGSGDHLTEPEAGPLHGWHGSAYQLPSDEISLVDIWLTLWRHWKLLTMVFVAGVCAALAVALLVPRAYRYDATVQIGEIPQKRGGGEQDVPIDSPKSVVALLNNSFIPAAVQKYTASHGEGSGPDHHYALDASVAQGSNVVTVSGKGPAGQAGTYKQLLSEATTALIRHENKLVDSAKSGLQAKLEQARLRLDELRNPEIFRATLESHKQTITVAKNKLSSLKDQQDVLKQRLARLKKKRQLLKSQITATRKTIDAADKFQLSAAKGAQSPTRAMSELLMGNTVQQSRNQLTKLEESLYVNVPNERANLQKKLHDNADAQEDQRSRITLLQSQLQKIKLQHRNRIQNQKQTVNALQARIGQLRPTQVLLAPTRSQDPVNSRKLIAVLGAVLSVMLGLFLVFLSELHQAARHRRKAEDAPPGSGDTEADEGRIPAVVGRRHNHG